MNNTFTQTNFTGGEISPRLLGRSDMVRYQNGAKTVQNFIGQKHGGLDRRPGTVFVAKTKHSGLNAPGFACSVDDDPIVTYGPVQSQDAYCKTAASNADAGDTAFVNPTRAQGVPNAVAATASVIAGQTSKYLHCTNFSFSIPADASVVGIGLTVTRKASLSSTISDHTIQMIKAGSRVGTNAPAAFTWSSVAFTDAPYGGGADLWGTTWTPAEVNASTFGMAIRVSCATSSDTASVDAVKITVYYRTVSIQTTEDDLTERGKCRLIPFQFSVEQAYVLEFGNLYVRVFTQDGQILSGGLPYEIVSPYSEDELDDIKYTQSADVLFLCHPSHSPRQLIRTADDNWAFALHDQNDGPYGPINTATDKLMAVSSVTPGSVTLTASGAGWGGTGPFVASDAATSTRKGLVVRILAATGTLWGWGEVTAFSTSFVVTLNLVSAPLNTTATKNWRLGQWSDTDGWPYVPTFHQERLWFGGSDTYPQTLWASEVGVFDSYEPSDLTSDVVADSNGLNYTIVSNQVNTVRWMFSTAKGMIVGASGAEFIVSATGLNGVITPESVTALPQSYNGSLSTARPIQISNAILFIQRHGRKVRDMVYKFDLDQHATNDLTIMAEHLGENRFKEMVYQTEPYSIAWLMDEDGDLFSMTYDREQDVISWATHVIGGVYDVTTARVESICVIQEDDEDRLWLVVKREINGRLERYVETLHDFFEALEDVSRDAFFVDSGLTYDGWNYDKCDQMTLADTSGWDFDDTGTMTATNHAPFTADSVGKYYRLDADPDGDDETWIDVLVTGYTSSTVVSVKFKNDIPTSLQDTAVTNWALLATAISGLDHLEGEDVSLLVDGGTHPGATVSAGAISLESGEFQTRAAVVHVGLDYSAHLETLPVSPDSFGTDVRGRVKSIYKASIRFHRTIGGEVGAGSDSLDPIASRSGDTPMGNPSELFTGTKALQLEGRYAYDATVFVQQNDPLPMQLLSISYEVDTDAV